MKLTNIAKPTVSFKMVPPTKPKKAAMAGLKDDCKVLPSYNSPAKAPKKGPKMMPKGPRKIPKTKPIVAPLAAYLLPPPHFTDHTGKK